MIWLKRALPFVVIIALWFGYRWFEQWSTQKVQSTTDRAAVVTARLMIASATYRADPDRYAVYRDSLLGANDFTKESLDAFIAKHNSDPDWSQLYAVTVKNYVDSLYRIEDSIRVAQKKLAARPSGDSLKVPAPIPPKPADTATRSGTRPENAPSGR
jgi:hypothetical protein